MKSDVLQWAAGRPTTKLVCKETLNHRGLIELVSGMDAYENTPEAYLRTYSALGIDIINRVPLQNAPPPTPTGQTRTHPFLSYNFAPLGVYDTAMRQEYLCRSPEEVWNLDVESLSYDDMLVPVPHPYKKDDIRQRHEALGPLGLYYPMLYTTLFMWAVELLGWEIFMIAAAGEPDRFHDHFLVPCAEKSKNIVEEIVAADDSPFLFVHDDLAGAYGPMFNPTWYRDYIFPHYPAIWEEAKRQDRKVIFVADGNMTEFLPGLIEAGIDGLMFENPATPLEAVIEHFGQPGRFTIGGIDTAVLTRGTPDDVRRMVFDLREKTDDCPGFAISSCGGLHDGLPLENLEAYFDARVELGATPPDWRTRCRAEPSF